MTAPRPRVSPLRRRMIEDMTVRNLSPATQRSYLHAVAKFSRYFSRSPDRLDIEDVRAFQVFLVSQKISWPALNQTVCALRFFYGVTLNRPEIPERIAYAREPRKLPVNRNLIDFPWRRRPALFLADHVPDGPDHALGVGGLISFAASSCGPESKSSSRNSVTQRPSALTLIPRSPAICRCLRPLVCKRRTASSLKARSNRRPLFPFCFDICTSCD